MNSGTFHVMSQEWRYFSREKSIIHTLHLGQLPPSGTGATILIDSTSPTMQGGKVGGFSVPSLNLPAGPGGGTINFTVSKNVLSQCFGSFYNKTILSQKNMDIVVGRWDTDTQQIIMTPHQSGWFFVHIDGNSDIRGVPMTYQGATVDVGTVQSTILISVRKNSILGSVIAQAGMAMYMGGVFDPTHWRADMYVTSQIPAYAIGIGVVAKGQPICFSGRYMGDPTQSSLSGYMYCFSDLPS